MFTFKRYIVCFLCSIRIGDTRWGQFITACTHRDKQAIKHLLLRVILSHRVFGLREEVRASTGNLLSHRESMQTPHRFPCMMLLTQNLHQLSLSLNTSSFNESFKPNAGTVPLCDCTNEPVWALFIMLHFFPQSLTVIREKEASNQQDGCTQYESKSKTISARQEWPMNKCITQLRHNGHISPNHPRHSTEQKPEAMS